MKAVMVTTEYRGVFFGYLEGEEGETVTLTNCRNCIYWSIAMKGVFGLAVYGPDQECKIGPRVSKITLRKVTSIVEVADSAVVRWESNGWAK